MSGYRIESFDGVWLPFYNVEQDQTGGASESPLVRTVNGYADVRGTRRAVARWRRSWTGCGSCAGP